MTRQRSGAGDDSTWRSRPRLVAAGVLCLGFLVSYVAVLVPTSATSAVQAAVGAVDSVLFWVMLRFVPCPSVRLAADRLVVVNPLLTYSVGSREVVSVDVDRDDGACMVRLREGGLITVAALSPSALGKDRPSDAGRRFAREALAWAETAAPGEGVHRSSRPAFVWLALVEAAWFVVWLAYVAASGL